MCHLINVPFSAQHCGSQNSPSSRKGGLASFQKGHSSESQSVSHFDSAADWLSYEHKMTKHSLCIRDHGQIPKHRLEDVCGPTPYPDKNLLSASARFHDDRKQREAQGWDNRTTAVFASSAPSPTEAMSYLEVLTFHLLQYVLLPKIEPVVYKESAWVSIMLWNLLSAFSPNTSCPSTWHRPYVQLSVEGEGRNLHHRHVTRQLGCWRGQRSPPPNLTYIIPLLIPSTAPDPGTRASALPLLRGVRVSTWMRLAFSHWLWSLNINFSKALGSHPCASRGGSWCLWPGARQLSPGTGVIGNRQETVVAFHRAAKAILMETNL